MSLKIRLARAGAKKRPYYRIVVADSKSPRDGRYIEKVGTYNPLLPRDSGERVKLVEDRIKHWMGVGAQPTDRVLRFLDKAGMAKRDARSNPTKAQPGKNILTDGSSQLVQTLLAADLVDELHLLLYPLAVGGGKRLFPEGMHTKFTLKETVTYPSGVVGIHYVRDRSQVSRA